MAVALAAPNVPTLPRLVPAAPSTAAPYRAVLDQYCVTCHNGTLLTAGLALDTADVETPSSAPDVWERVIRKLRTRTMPPGSRPRPDESSYEAIAGYLEQAIDRGTGATLNPGRTSTVHRLNRTEYRNDRQSEDTPLGSRGGVAVPFNFPVDGEYFFKVGLRANWQDYILGMGSEHELDLRIDGQRMHRFKVGGETTARPAPTTFTIAEPGHPDWEEYVLHADERLEVRIHVRAGPRIVSVSFVRRMWEPEGILQPRQAGEVLSNDESYNGQAAVDTLSIGGPYEVTGAGDTPSRREIFVCHPLDGADEESCAREILMRLVRRGYRRPATDDDVETLMRFFDDGRQAHDSFDAGIQLALERLLVDPDFLLRIERDPAEAAPGGVYRLSDIEVASRLSFFLWNSIPDEALLSAAEEGTLTEPSTLDRHVRRMLADPRARWSTTSRFSGCIFATWRIFGATRSRFPISTRTLLRRFEPRPSCSSPARFLAIEACSSS